jgi:hypothetical protein
VSRGTPTYELLTESPAQFASSVANVLGGFDVINVQDSGGSGYEQPSDITNWFTALHKALAGTRGALWDDPDMFPAGNKGGPRRPETFAARRMFGVIRRQASAVPGSRDSRARAASSAPPPRSGGPKVTLVPLLGTRSYLCVPGGRP